MFDQCWTTVIDSGHIGQTLGRCVVFAGGTCITISFKKKYFGSAGLKIVV